MKKRRKSLILGIILLLCGLGIGYAFLNTTLSINGIAEVESNTWDIYWDNVQVTSGSVTAETPTIDTNKTTVSFSVHLSKPGDFYEFTVDAVNDGSIDGMVDIITKTVNSEISIPNYLNFIVTYIDGIEIAKNQLLASDTFETYKVRVEYRTDIDKTELPDEAESLNLVFGVTYVQADNSSQLVRRVVYTSDDSNYQIGSNIPSDAQLFDDYQDAIDESGYNYFLKHVVVNNVIKESYVGFVVEGDNNVYYIKGAGATCDGYNCGVSPFYELNKEYLYNSLPGACYKLYDETFETTACSLTNLELDLNEKGAIQAARYFDSGYTCYVNATGDSSCYISF